MQPKSNKSKWYLSLVLTLGMSSMVLYSFGSLFTSETAGIHYFHDESKNLAIAEVKTTPRDQWVPLNSPLVGMISGALWVEIDLTKAIANEDVVFFLLNHWLTSIEAFGISKESNKYSIPSFSQYPFPNFLVEGKKNQKIFFLRIESPFLIFLGYQIFTPKESMIVSNMFEFMLGGYFGIVFLSLAISFFAFVLTRSSTYFYFSLVIFSCNILNLSLFTGLAYEFLFSKIPLPSINLTFFIVFFMFFSYCLLIRHYLDKKNIKNLYTKFLQPLGYSLFTLAFICLFINVDFLALIVMPLTLVIIGLGIPSLYYVQKNSQKLDSHALGFACIIVFYLIYQIDLWYNTSFMSPFIFTTGSLIQIGFHAKGFFETYLEKLKKEKGLIELQKRQRANDRRAGELMNSYIVEDKIPNIHTKHLYKTGKNLEGNWIGYRHIKENNWLILLVSESNTFGLQTAVMTGAIASYADNFLLNIDKSKSITENLIGLSQGLNSHILEITSQSHQAINMAFIGIELSQSRAVILNANYLGLMVKTSQGIINIGKADKVLGLTNNISLKPVTIEIPEGMIISLLSKNMRESLQSDIVEEMSNHNATPTGIVRNIEAKIPEENSIDSDLSLFVMEIPSKTA